MPSGCQKSREQVKQVLKTIFLAKPRGFCAGVERAIEIVDILLGRHGPPIYVKHELVHNRRVINEFISRGVVFIEDPEDVPAGSILVYSAHGVSRQVRRTAEARNLQIHDATCPLVTKVHAQVARMRAAGREILMIGHARHPEVEGTMGQVDDGIVLVQTEEDARTLHVSDPGKVSYVTQTTLSVDETADILAILRARFPQIKGPLKEDICYATQNRQEAVKKLAPACDLVLVVGSPNSSNSNRLKEIAQRHGVHAELIDCAEQIDPRWLDGAAHVGVTAGASAPEKIVSEIIAHLRNFYPAARVREMAGLEETVTFAVPKSVTCTDLSA